MVDAVVLFLLTAPLPGAEFTPLTEFTNDSLYSVRGISADGTLGWVIAQVHIVGTSNLPDGSKQDFESTWGWIELVATETAHELEIDLAADETAVQWARDRGIPFDSSKGTVEVEFLFVEPSDQGGESATLSERASSAGSVM